MWVLAIGYAMATAVSLHASESLELGEEVFSNNCGKFVMLQEYALKLTPPKC